MDRERMLVIANSRKLGGRCVAGVSLLHHAFLRPVAAEPNTQLYMNQCGIDGRQPSLLEVVEFDHLGHDGDTAQPENVLIAGTPWARGDQISKDEALDVLRSVKHTETRLFGNSGKAVHVDDTTDGVPESLLVLEPSHVRFEHRAGAHARVLFRNGGRDWDLALTDFPVHAAVLSSAVGVYTPEDLGLPSTLLLTVSLALPHNNWHSKLVAAVLAFP